MVMSTMVGRVRAPRRRVAVSLLAVGVLGLAACGSDDEDTSSTAAPTTAQSGTTAPSETPAPSTTKAPKKGGTLVFGGIAEIRGWLPQQLQYVNSGEDRGALVYDTLLSVDGTGNWKPNMAESLTTTDGQSWTMKLKNGIKFTDGTALDAAAVKFNVELTKDPAMGAAEALLAGEVNTITVVDPLTVKFDLKAPNGSFPYSFTKLMGMMISPTAYNADKAGFSKKPVGAGPFMVQSWTPDSKAVLVRNPTYWGGEVYLDGVDYRIIPDLTARSQALLSGQLDVAYDANSKIPSNYKTVNSVATGGSAIVANQDKAPFGDVRVRKAIALALDPKLVSQSLFNGTWEEQSVDCMPWAPGLDECKPGLWPKHDLNAAKALIAEYEKEKGEIKGPFTLLGVPVNQGDAEMLQQTLASIGIEPVTLKLVPAAEYVPLYAAGSFDLAWTALASFTGPPSAFTRNLIDRAAGGRHVQGGPVDPALEKLLSEVSKAVERKDRVAAAHKLLEINASQFLYIFWGPYRTARMVSKGDVVFPDSWKVGVYGEPGKISIQR